jgi:fibro-slime domain-containing protein
MAMKKACLIVLSIVGIAACGGKPEAVAEETETPRDPDSGLPDDDPSPPGTGPGEEPDPIFEGDDDEQDDDVGEPTCRADGGGCQEPPMGDAGPACGDGFQHDSEDCDDGNTLPGDGCNGACVVEPNSLCEEPGMPCVSTLVCGDGQVDPGEICDDGNDADGDGCSADCTEQDPAFVCVPGEECFQLYVCGDSRVSPAAGESCEDGNQMSDDGCSAECEVEEGYSCPIPGQTCSVLEVCGDASLAAGEQCDDGALEPGDGCSAECRVEADWVCDPAGGCIYLVVCGDGIINGTEACDDANTNAGDGCSDDCTAVEEGWACMRGGFPCRTACGDGLIRGLEQCDDGETADADGCSGTCRVETNTVCDGEPSVCATAVCGQNGQEGTEPCDDGNNDWGDGCTPTCRIEPTCPAGQSCSSACGDGIKFPAEACDDGNAQDGDGCSAICEVEPGFTCAIDDVDLSALELPIIYRDFAAGAPHEPTTFPDGITSGHKDFEWPPTQWGTGVGPDGTYEDENASAADNEDLDHVWPLNTSIYGFRQGFVRSTLGGTADAEFNGKPVFAFADLDGGDDCPLEEGAMRRDGEGFCVLQVQNRDSFGQWFRDVDGLNLAFRRTLILDETADGTFVYDSNTHASNGTLYEEGDPVGFWPLDELGTTGNQCSGTARNFHFTSEVHHWFQFDAATPPTLTFTGDDDVFVFIGGQLALDLGGVHSRLEGIVALDANGDATTTISDGGDELVPEATIPLGLVDGSIYEIVVFQAERNRCESNYRLELKNFNLLRSVCTPRCGDGVVTLDEECDDGDESAMTPLNEPPNNTPTPEYDSCTADVCTLGPYCGDGDVNGDEPCDNGSNRSVWGDTSASACSPGCVLPPVCGDGNVDSPFEECDDAASNDEEGYESCTTTCVRGPFCGDGIENGPETCDDGVNDGRYGGCTPECTPAPNCGDGVVQEEWGEQCDGGENCSDNCRLGAQCGDGVIQEELGEQCDDGVNAGGYGECGPMCTIGAYCGDGVPNGPEQCDDGVNDGGYGECDLNCRLGPFCGDGDVNGPEKCDDGNQQAGDGCTPACVIEKDPGAR